MISAKGQCRTLSDSARIQLLHACKHNPGVITAHLWPYALKHANNLFNALPRDGNDQSPEQIFSKSPADPNIGEIHPFGCPVYVLASELKTFLQKVGNLHYVGCFANGNMSS